MELTRIATVAAPQATCWEILGPNYAKVGDWASSVYLSEPRPGPPKVAGAPLLGRVRQTSLGPITETLLAYDPDRGHLAYSAAGEKTPGLLRALRNAWTLRALGPNETEVRMALTADIAFPFNVLMGWMMRRQFRRVLGEAMEEFQHFAETGTPHPRKRQVDASAKALAARKGRA